MRSPEETRAIRIGFLFQIPMAVLFVYISLHYRVDRLSALSPWMIPSHIGSAVFLYCLVTLYVLKKKDNKLITTGLFKYTRHPMYTGFVLMMMALWLPRPVSTEPLFFLLQAVFLFLLIMAAWHQEKETLARFGKAAEEYYAKTPRLFFMYPFYQRPQPRI
jgi:protein-S-isoprenylcysteine O-methyltransferase Ste14